MSGFWVGKDGKKITGNPADAFVKDFTTIPEGTTAVANIKAMQVVNKEASEYAEAQKYIQVTYKLLDGDFKGREVTQKIKCFEGKPEQIERNKNMLMLIMKLCDFQPSHSNEPTDSDLGRMCEKVIGIVIGEWSLPKKDGSGTMEGNFVRECLKAEGFKSETGIKAVMKSVVNTAFSRNKPGDDELFPNSDIPF